MRLIYITLPVGLLLTGIGAAMLINAVKPAQANLGIDFNQPKHPVTAEMLQETLAMSLKEAPKFEENDVLGKPQKIGGPENKPQFVLFILDGCPCSVDAQPLFNRLYRQFGGKVDFVGVTNGDFKKAKDWKITYSVPFPIVPDPEKKVIKAYEAKNSVYSALVNKDGKIAKMWPGYSHDILIEMNALMAKEAGTPKKTFDPAYAPKEKSSGCAF